MNPAGWKQYFEDCSALSEDLNLLIADRLLEAAGRKVFYAIDFVEIYRYVHAKTVWSDMRLFRADDDDTNKAAELFILERLFSGARPLILLNSYAIELAAFRQYIAAEAMGNLLSDATGLLNEIRLIESSTDFADIARWATEHEDAPSPRERTSKLFEYIERHAAKLLRLVGTVSDGPAERLARILADAKLIRLNALGISEDDLELDTNLILRWDNDLRKLRGKRPPAASHLDARAVAVVRAANQRLSKQGVHVYLVTRSTTMRTVALKESGRELTTSVLRHPRSLLAWYLWEGDSEGTVAHMEKMRASLDVFVESYRELLATSSSALKRQHASKDRASIKHGDVDLRLSEIQRQWRVRVGLSSWRGLSRREGEHRRDETRLHEVVRLLQDNREIGSYVGRRIRELGETIDRQNQYLAIALQGVEGSEPNIPLAWVPYQLEFRSRQLQIWAHDLGTARIISIPSILRTFERETESEPDYEVLLSVAYLCAKLGKWALAKRYCELALKDRRDGDAEPHEGLFFLSVCLRKEAPLSDERFLEAIELLRRARNERQRDDPRYLAENCVVLLLRSEQLVGASRETLVAEAIELGRKSLDISENAPQLRAEVHNNLCYYFVTRGSTNEHRVQAEHHYQELVSLQARLQPVRQDWPPHLLDTEVWARWRLSEGRISPTDVKSMKATLRHVLRKLGTEGHEGELVREHLRQIEASTAGRAN